MDNEEIIKIIEQYLKDHSYDKHIHNGGDFPVIDKKANGIPTLPMSVANGGTGISTLVTNRLIVGRATSPVSNISEGSSGNVLTSQGAGFDPVFQALPAQVPGWADEGSLSWSAENTSKTLTLANAGKDLYMIFIVMPNLGTSLDMQVNGVTGSNYSYVFYGNAGVANSGGTDTKWRLRDGVGAPLISTYYINGKHDSGQKTIVGNTGADNANINKMLNGMVSGNAANLSSITLIPGGSVTGKMHVYSLNL